MFLALRSQASNSTVVMPPCSSGTGTTGSGYSAKLKISKLYWASFRAHLDPQSMRALAGSRKLLSLCFVSLCCIDAVVPGRLTDRSLAHVDAQAESEDKKKKWEKHVKNDADRASPTFNRPHRSAHGGWNLFEIKAFLHLSFCSHLDFL